jgi:hypothetical protein
MGRPVLDAAPHRRMVRERSGVYYGLPGLELSVRKPYCMGFMSTHAHPKRGSGVDHEKLG